MLKPLFHLFLFFIFFYCFYQLNGFVKIFPFLTNGESVESMLEENSQLDDVLESLNSPSDTNQEIENENEGITEINNFYDAVDVLCESHLKKCNDSVNNVNNYIQRYISLFLIISNLQEYKVTDENEEISFDLEISISGQDLSYLQGYSKKSISSSLMKKFSKLDMIFSNIARAKERSYMEKTMWFSKSFLAHLNIFRIINQPRFQSLLIFLIICVMTWTFLVFFKNYVYFCLGIIINSAFIWEGLNNYWRKVKEADIEIYVKTLQSKSEVCDPNKMGWYDSFMSLFSENQCLQYHKNLNKNPAEDVSLFKCIFDIYSFYFIEMPVKLFGTSIRDFTGEISALWPWPVRVLMNIPLVIIFTFLAGGFILILFGKRCRLSFFGAAVEIGDAGFKPDKEKIADFTAIKSPKSFRVTRKLKPWTKSRFPKRLDDNNLRHGKLHLKLISKTEVQHRKELQSGSLDGEICSPAAAKED